MSDPTQESKERFLWRCEDAIKSYGRAEYDAGEQAGGSLHKAALQEATRQFDYCISLLHQAVYGANQKVPSDG